MTSKKEDRYSRQVILKEIGSEGQNMLLESSGVVVGCGALGGVIANNLTRAGIGHLTVVDRDIVELNNLQRQSLFNEEDVGSSKAVSAVEKLQRINSEILIDSVVVDVNFSNAEEIIQDCDLVIDATDNMETRFLINDTCVKNDTPWIYGGAIGTYGMTMNIIPNGGPCLRCIIPALPEAGTMPTCDTEGVLNTIPTIIAAIECTEAVKILLGLDANKSLLVYDIWSHNFQCLEVQRDENCECCGKHNFEFLETEKKEIISSLCGTNTTQIIQFEKYRFSFGGLAEKLRRIGEVEVKEGLIKFKTGEYTLNIFRDGRTLIQGTEDEKIARSLFAKFVGK